MDNQQIKNQQIPIPSENQNKESSGFVRPRQNDNIIQQTKEEYLSKFQTFENLKKKRLELQQKNDTIQQNLQQSLQQLQDQVIQITKNKKIHTKIEKNKAEIVKKKQQLEEKKQQILQQKDMLKQRSELLSDRSRFLEAFDDLVTKKYKDCQVDYQTIEIKETLLFGRRKLFLYQLCSIFCNSEIAHVFNYLVGVYKVFNDYQQIQEYEQSINCSLGYFLLFLLHIAKYHNITLKYQMIFQGSKSQIQKGTSEGEFINLYIFKNKEKDIEKFKYALDLFIQNLQVVFNALGFPKQKLQPDLQQSLDLLCRFTYHGQFNIKFKPENLDKQKYQSNILKLINELYACKPLSNDEFCVAVNQIDIINNYIEQGSGDVIFKLKLTLLILKISKDEVYTAPICSQNDRGITLNLAYFKIFVPYEELFPNSLFLRGDDKKWVWKPNQEEEQAEGEEETIMEYTTGQQCRLKIINADLYSLQEKEKIIGQMNIEGLGPVQWWQEEENTSDIEQEQ